MAEPQDQLADDEQVSVHEVVQPGPVQALAALFDDGLPAPEVGEELPPLWHWVALPRWPQAGQDIIYRPAAEPASGAGPALLAQPGRAPALLQVQADGSWRLRTDPVLLARFSAATANGHRIHYDWPYATGVEGYPGLVVHGPLMTLSLLETGRLARPQDVIAAVEHRNKQPLFRGQEAVLRHMPSQDGATWSLTLSGGGDAATPSTSATAGNGSELVVAGGTESMSNAAFYSTDIRWGAKGAAVQLHDGLARARSTAGGQNYPVPGGMLETAENLRREYGISRLEQDELALASHRRAVAAQRSGVFAEEIIPVEVPARKGVQVVEVDEHPRADTSLESLAKLTPILQRSAPEATVTAGNASGQNDGAAVCLVTTAERAERLGLRPLVRLVSWGLAWVPPRTMGIGPVPATQAAPGQVWPGDHVRRRWAGAGCRVRADRLTAMPHITAPPNGPRRTWED